MVRHCSQHCISLRFNIESSKTLFPSPPPSPTLIKSDFQPCFDVGIQGEVMNVEMVMVMAIGSTTLTPPMRTHKYDHGFAKH